jgi:hypothetical protein
MGIKVILGKKKLTFFLKLQPSVIAHFEDKVSGDKYHIHDLILFCLFRAVLAVKVEE